MTNDPSWWIVIAFSAPPHSYGFRRSKKGNSWVRCIQGKSWAIQLGRTLAGQDIHGIIKRIPEELQPKATPHRRPKPNLSHSADPQNPRADKRQGGFGGGLNATPIKGAWRLRKRKR